MIKPLSNFKQNAFKKSFFGFEINFAAFIVLSLYVF